MSSASSYRSCGICFENYGAVTDDGTTVIPMHLSCCGNHLCFDCAEKYRAEETSKLSGNRKKIPCFSCKQLFHSSKDTPWTVARAHIGLLGIEVDTSAVREAEAARDVSRSSNPPRHQRDIAHTETSIRRSSRRLAGTIRDQSDNEEHESASVGVDVELASVRITRAARKRTRRSHNNTIQNNLHSPSGMQQPVTVHGAPSSLNDNEDRDEEVVPTSVSEQLWHDKMAGLRSGTSDIYRVRILITTSKTDEDRFARKCSFWCLKKGYVLCSPRMIWATTDDGRIPDDLEAAKDLVRSRTKDELKNMCLNSAVPEMFQQTNAGSTMYVDTDKKFLEMIPGDFVVMHMKGGYGKNDPPQTLVFGVIEDDTLVYTSYDDLMTKQKFPWDPTTRCPSLNRGFIFRKVRWLRQGELRAIRGKSQANWLAEAQTIWFAKVGGKTRSHYDEAVKRFGSQEFMSSTKEVTDAWIDRGLNLLL